MGTFSALESAMRMREILKQQAQSTVEENLPAVLVGRFTQVDLDNMKGNIWFPGDDQPTEVNLLPNTIPATWDSGGDSMTGRGSTAMVQQINGKYYATEILSGGSFSIDATSAGFGLRAERPGSRGYGANPLNDVYEFYANLDLPDYGEEFFYGDALIFGPFVTRNFVTGLSSEDFGGFIKIALSHRDQTTRLYESVISANDLSSAGGWMRLQPYQEVSYDGTDNVRFELDIRRYANGDVVDENGDAVPAFYFRIMNGVNNFTDFSFKVAINAGGLFNYARTQSNRNRLTVTHEYYPDDHQGYVGFHSSGSVFNDVIGIRDSMIKIPRSFSSGLGWGPTTGDPSVSWTHTNSINQYNTDGFYASIRPNLTVSDFMSRLPGSKKDTELEFWFDVQPGASAATGNFFEVLAYARWNTATNTGYRFAAVFNTAGDISAYIQKVVSGTITNLGNVTIAEMPTPAYTSDANANVFKMKVRCVGSSLKINVWKANFADENSWKVEVTDSSITTAGQTGIGVNRGSGNTNGNLRVYYYQYVESVQVAQTASAETWNTGPYRSPRLRAAADLQRTIVTEGTVRYIDGYVSWDEPIEFGGIGTHPNILSEGRAYASFPVWNVTDIDRLPVFPVGLGNIGSFLVGPSGIFIQPGHSLWCAIPPGYPNLDLMKYMFLVDSTKQATTSQQATPIQYGLPEWSVFIVGRSLSGVVKTGLGVQPAYPNGLSFHDMGVGHTSMVNVSSPFNITSTTVSSSDPNNFIRMRLRRNARYKYEARIGYGLTGSGALAKFQWIYQGTGGTVHVNPTNHWRFAYGNGIDNTTLQSQVSSMYNNRRDGTNTALVGSFNQGQAGSLGVISSFWEHGVIDTSNGTAEMWLGYGVNGAGQTLTIHAGSYLEVTRIK